MLSPKSLCLSLLILAGLLSQASASTTSVRRPQYPQPSSLPNRQIAGVTVVDTPIVRAAQAYARAHSSDWVYGHVMRSWLFGALMIAGNDTLRAEVDLEVHAVSALLHDLGWDRQPNSPVISRDRRFEVDGAIAARSFIQGYHQHGHNHHEGEEWDERRVQLVWDAIALHSERSIALFKETVVSTVSLGIGLDFFGPLSFVRQGDYDRVVHRFPKTGFVDGVNGTIIWLCQTKPGTTYDTWMQPWGDEYVPDYSAVGSRRIDNLFRNVTDGRG